MPRITEFTIDIDKDNSKQVTEALKEQLKRGLKAIGESAEGYAKDGCPVDTGRLRDSITYKTEEDQGNPGPKAQAGDASPKGNPAELEVVIGTNVEYAKYQEFGTRYRHTTGGPHFLKNAASNHGAEYKKILEAAMKS